MKKVAILGFGGEGLSAYHYFAAKPNMDITIFDDKAQPNMPVPEGAHFRHGKDSYKDLSQFDIVVRFPAISPARIHTNGEVTSVIQEFFKACPAPIIGVTGTKGKGTTSTLIYEMLSAAGKRVHIAGNIGVPALNILADVQADDVVVLELSSFQLWDLKHSPHIAVVLMVEQEHLDIHADMQDYLDAKKNIVRWQKPHDITVYLPHNNLTEEIALTGAAKKIPYTEAPGAHVENGQFVIDGTVICPTKNLKLPGQHNIQNACAAITAVWQLTQDAAALAQAIATFKGLPHRLSFIREVNGVSFYDDSFATTPTSAIAALRSFTAPKVIILGGSDKGADFTELGQEVAASTMRGVILIGLMRHKLHNVLTKAGYTGPVEFFDETSTMPQIVEAAARLSQNGDAVIISPACASFDMFRDYKDRGEKFIAAVEALHKKAS